MVPGQGGISLPWAIALVKCAAVWMPMLTHIQASHTGVLKTHVREVPPCSGKSPLFSKKKMRRERKNLFDLMGLVSYGGGKRFTEHGILRASAGGTGSGSAPAATPLTSGNGPWV